MIRGKYRNVGFQAATEKLIRTQGLRAAKLREIGFQRRRNSRINIGEFLM